MLFAFGRETRNEHLYNLIPFETIQKFLIIGSHNQTALLINIFGNIVIFMPFGILIPQIFKGNFLKNLAIFELGILSLETLQLLTRKGSFDIDDFILNTVGFLLGYLILKIMLKYS